MIDFMRLLVAFVVLGISFVTWKWMQSKSTAATTFTSTSSGKKKNRKKRKSKKERTPERYTGDVVGQNTPAQSSPPQQSDLPEEESDNDSDSDDDGRKKASKVLSERRFKPKAVGGASQVPTSDPIPKYTLGQRVYADYQNGPHKFPGIIHEVRRDNKYHIQFDDGGFEYNVPYSNIQIPDDQPAKEVVETKQEETKQEERLVEPEVDHDDDGWEIVGPTKRNKPKSAPEPASNDGLTKRQRESRRKKERQKEIRDMVRERAQEDGLHARWGGSNQRYRYVPPPPTN